MSSVPTSRTKKNGANKKRQETLGKCVMCQIHIPTIISVLYSTTILPVVLDNIVGEYIGHPTQYIGYNILHPPSRRCYHIACIECVRHMTDVCVTNGRDRCQCLYPGCWYLFDIFNITQNVLK